MCNYACLPCTIISALLSSLLGGLDSQQVTTELFVAADASTDSVLIRPSVLTVMTARYG